MIINFSQWPPSGRLKRWLKGGHDLINFSEASQSRRNYETLSFGVETRLTLEDFIENCKNKDFSFEGNLSPSLMDWFTHKNYEKWKENTKTISRKKRKIQFSPISTRQIGEAWVTSVNILFACDKHVRLWVRLPSRYQTPSMNLAKLQVASEVDR